MYFDITSQFGTERNSAEDFEAFLGKRLADLTANVQNIVTIFFFGFPKGSVYAVTLYIHFVQKLQKDINNYLLADWREEH